MKNAFICALLIGALGSLCNAQQPANCKGANCGTKGAARQTASAGLPAFGPVLLPNLGKHAPAPRKAADATKPTAVAVTPVAAPVQQESLGEIARRYRSQKPTQQHPEIEMGLQ